MKNSNLSLVQFMSLTHHQHTSQTLTCNHKPSRLFTNVYPAIIIHQRMFCDHYSPTYVLRSLFTNVCSAIIIHKRMFCDHYSQKYVLRSLFIIHQRMFCDHYSPTYVLRSLFIIHQRMFCDHYSPTYVLRSLFTNVCSAIMLAPSVWRSYFAS